MVIATGRLGLADFRPGSAGIGYEVRDALVRSVGNPTHFQAD